MTHFPPSSCPPPLRWEMEVEEIEAVLEKIWDLHDKISDAIHSVSKAYFLKSTRHQEKPSKNQEGFVFMKECRSDKDEFSEARSLNAIRTALENLEDQLEFYHTVHSQQRAERDAAIAQLEQSRLILAMKLADYHGKKYAVIEEALAFVGSVDQNFIAPEDLTSSQMGKNTEVLGSKGSNFVMQIFSSSFNLVRKSLKLETVAGLIGNAALIAASMIAVLQFQQLTVRSGYLLDVEEDTHLRSTITQRKSLPCECRGKKLDVLLARG
ncbi:unnamed protein product [Victoria cruziana]